MIDTAFPLKGINLSDASKGTALKSNKMEDTALSELNSCFCSIPQVTRSKPLTLLSPSRVTAFRKE